MSGWPNCPHWLLALTIPFSRSDRARTGFAGGGAGWPEGLFRTDCSAGESPSAVRRPWEAVPTGCTPYQTARAPSTRFLQTGRKRPWKAQRPSEGTLGKPHGLDTVLDSSVPREPSRTRGSPPRVTAGSRFHAKIRLPFLCGDGSRPPERGRKDRWPTPTPAVACEEPPGPLARHPAFEAQRAFRSTPSHRPGTARGERAPLVDLLDLPLVCELWSSA